MIRSLLIFGFVSVCLHTLSAATVPPCERVGPTFGGGPGVTLPEPVEPLQPVPSDGTFTCGSLIFSGFSANILNGGLIGATWFPDPFGAFQQCPPGASCTGN